MEYENLQWQKIKSGDISVLEIFYKTYFDEFYFYGLKIIPIPDLVKDAIQDVFITIWEKRATLGSIQNLKAYFFTVLRRTLIQTIECDRKTTSQHHFDNDLFSFSAEDFIIDEENASEIRQKLKYCLAELSPRQREVIILRFYHTMEFSEMAEVLQMNVQSVRNLLFRAIGKIRDQIEATKTDDVKVPQEVLSPKKS